MRVVVSTVVNGRTYTLFVEERRGKELKYQWFEGQMFLQHAGFLEKILVDQIQHLEGEVVRMRCLAWKIRDCRLCSKGDCFAKIGLIGLTPEEKAMAKKCVPNKQHEAREAKAGKSEKPSPKAAPRGKKKGK